ncbi:hypothetical protein ACFL6U_17755 [Planctomycetota bacterium]
MYDTEWHTKGSLIYADERLYCYEEKDGNLALVKPNPKEFEVVSSFQITKGEDQHWAHPTIYEKTLYVRHGDVPMAFDIAAPTPYVSPPSCVSRSPRYRSYLI